MADRDRRCIIQYVEILLKSKSLVLFKKHLLCAAASRAFSSQQEACQSTIFEELPRLNTIDLNQLRNSPQTNPALVASNEYDSTRKYLKRQTVNSPKKDRELWWALKAREMENAFAAGNSRALYQPIRSTGPRKATLITEVRQRWARLENSGQWNDNQWKKLWQLQPLYDKKAVLTADDDGWCWCSIQAQWVLPEASWTELQRTGSGGKFAEALTKVVQESAWTQNVVAPTRCRTGQLPSLLNLAIANERHFIDQVLANAPMGHSDHCVLLFDFVCYWLTARDTDELAFRKMRNRCKSEIRQWNIRKQATILGLAQKNKNMLFNNMRHCRRIKPTTFSLRDKNGEPTSDQRVTLTVLWMIRRTFSRITRMDFQTLYGAYVRLLLEYANQAVCSGRKEEVSDELLRKWLPASNPRTMKRTLTVLWMIRRTFSRITRMDFQTLYGAYVRLLLEYANQAVCSGRKEEVSDELLRKWLPASNPRTMKRYRRLRGDMIPTSALFEQSLTNRLFTGDPENTRREHGEGQQLNVKNKPDGQAWSKASTLRINPRFDLLVADQTQSRLDWLGCQPILIEHPQNDTSGYFTRILAQRCRIFWANPINTVVIFFLRLRKGPSAATVLFGTAYWAQQQAKGRHRSCATASKKQQ
ncbi:hypothetical protein CLF_107136 [Clonorchis sinensis]|uniref:Endonuclease/exonuclease/phosphatase domain-containing protein n=1 Tax=Clonorchis sinensis TaxID=79923 RepID=G7YG73_CLOSI|nr:hypothetical protein CLF_107136 [Clonorchis sinensis]